MHDTAKLEFNFYRAIDRQHRHDAEIAKSIIRILRDDVRGLARGPAHELRQLGIVSPTSRPEQFIARML
jgi:hypothetical protein